MIPSLPLPLKHLIRSNSSSSAYPFVGALLENNLSIAIVGGGWFPRSIAFHSSIPKELFSAQRAPPNFKQARPAPALCSSRTKRRRLPAISEVWVDVEESRWWSFEVVDDEDEGRWAPSVPGPREDIMPDEPLTRCQGTMG